MSQVYTFHKSKALQFLAGDTQTGVYSSFICDRFKPFILYFVCIYNSANADVGLEQNEVEL